jgi:fluoride exporter
MDVLAVGLAGVVGACLRYLMSWLVGDRLQLAFFGSFPIGTWAVNMIGSFCLAWFTAVMLKYPKLSERVKLGITTGLLGSFTTLSSWSVETVTLIQSDQIVMALVYFFASAGLGYTAVWIGYRFGTQFGRVGEERGG